MLSDMLLVGALLLRVMTPVVAMPQFLRQDGICTATVTVYASTGHSLPISPLSSLNGPQTVTVISTATITSTVTASLASGGGQQISDSPGSAGPQTVTATVTSIMTSVETQTLVQTQTVTQDRTIYQTETATQTRAQTNGVQTAVADPNGAFITYLTVTSTFTTTLTTSISVPAATVPPQQNISPPYSNSTETGQYRNPAKPLTATTSARLSIQPISSPSPALTTAVLVSTPSGTTSHSPANFSSSGYENGLYFVNWGIYGADFQPQSIPADKITRVYYAFADIDSDGTVKTSDAYADTDKHYPTDSWGDVNSTSNAYGCVKQLFRLKKANRHMKVLLSIGGWTYSSKFAPAAASPAARQTFADSALALVTDYGFDGVDIDWEFNAYAAAAADAANIILLLKALRTTFDAWTSEYAPGYRFLVTVASPAGPATYKQWDLAAMDPYVDSWNLMAYDYAGSWDTTSGHASNIYAEPAANPGATPYNTDEAVTAYISAGVAPAKIILGMPLYGRSFDGTSGLGQTYSTVGVGDGLGAGQWRYKNLPRPGAVEMYDSVARAAYSYDSATSELISYDNAVSLKAKGDYLMSRGLGGSMFWEASSDKNGTDSLVATMAGMLGSLDLVAQNLLDFPTSKYTNIRNGLA